MVIYSLFYIRLTTTLSFKLPLHHLSTLSQLIHLNYHIIPRSPTEIRLYSIIIVGSVICILNEELTGDKRRPLLLMIILLDSISNIHSPNQIINSNI